MATGTRNAKNRNDQDSTSDSTVVDRSKVARMAMASNKKKKKKKQSPSWWLWGSVGAVLVGWLVMYLTGSGRYSVENFLSTFVCQAEDGYCHDGLIPHGRTQQTTKNISPGERVLVVPRRLQIWDLDALRDDFIRKQLFRARHSDTGNPLDSAAFLAAFLARRMYYLNAKDDVMKPYFNILPTYEALEKTHPALWTDRRLSALLEPHSFSFTLAKGYHDMVRSEYDAFASISSKFTSQVTEREYITMRVNVLTRSFGVPGPPGEEEEAGDEMTLQDELEMYQTMAGVDLSVGCYAMVPILDMYDHHPVPNVKWAYDHEERAFVITASMPIPPGQDIMDSYGTYTDPHLFAKFGFNNGDGSGLMEATIANLHKTLDIGMKRQYSYMSFSGNISKATQEKQKYYLSRYFHFDDGYEECIQKELNPSAYELKKLKLEHLMRIANLPERWNMKIEPRVAHSLPSLSSNMPITYDVPKFDFGKLRRLDASKIISTCRLVALAEYDFDGNATNVLKEALVNDTEPIFVKVQGDDLEYRALACLARLSGLGRYRYQQKEQELIDQIKELSFQSRKWTTSQVKLGDMQSLEVIQKLALSGIIEMTSRIKEREESESDDVLPFVRETPCPHKYTNALLEEEEEEEEKEEGQE